MRTTFTLVVDWYDVLMLAAWSLLAASVLHAWRESKRSAHEKALDAANKK